MENKDGTWGISHEKTINQRLIEIIERLEKSEALNEELQKRIRKCENDIHNLRMNF